MKDDKRKTTRTDMERRIYIVREDEQYGGMIKNISLKNALLFFDNEVRLCRGERVAFAIPLAAEQDAEEFTIRGEADVKRIVSARSCAIEVAEIDVDSFSLLKRMLEYAFQDESVVRQDMVNLFKPFMEE